EAPPSERRRRRGGGPASPGPEGRLGRKNLLDKMPRRVGARLGGDCRRREVRATIVAEPRASGVLVSTKLAAHWALAQSYPHPRVSHAGPRIAGRELETGTT